MRVAYWCLFLATVLLAGCDEPPPYQPRSVETAARAKLHVGDAGKGRVAAENCATCHGLDGVSARSGAPFIAGLDQDYLVRSMMAYVNGARKHEDMQRITAALGPNELADVSAYYAGLATPWKGAVPGDQSKALAGDTQAAAAGARLAKSCDSCHGEQTGTGMHRQTPRLAGMPREYFEASLGKYFSGARQHDIMRLFRQSLSKQDIHNLAAYYAAQRPRKPPHPEAGNAASGKALASECAGCHGYDGNTLNPYMPNLAGQPAEYLVKAIDDYRAGRRRDDLMTAPVARLSERQVADLAAYFAMQQPESPLHKDIASGTAFHPLEDGEKIAASCNGCHGENGNSRKPGVPSLTGQHVKYLVTATTDYHNGWRKHSVMEKMTHVLSDTDIEKVSYYYATREPVKADMPAIGDVAQGEQLSPACTMCHGERGVSQDPAMTPRLAGQDALYLVEATRAYAKGGRKNDSMQSAAEGLSAADLNNLAAYFAAQAPQKAETFLPEDPAVLVVERCNRCHGERGYSTSEGIPRLAGQLESYLVVAMQEYQLGARKSSMMHSMAQVLSMLEIRAIAAYYAQQ